ncbi:unnamed protein product [Rotaria socialis]|uniref:Uncharacterized protein n=1 Tax=Rotaria socialis TaxID=392032 RepID=A0A820MYM1_9BILA|nr:unnamed protein product [Rotaria socialis]CAF4379954.1 unnamed protein product [Rotaria socialis]
MQQYRCLLFIIVFIIDSSEIFGQQYEWSGSYQWSDDECNQKQCWCPHGTLSVISNDTSIGFISNLRGRDCEQVTFSLWSPYPSDLVGLYSVPDENETLLTFGTICHKYGDVQNVSIVQLELISGKEAQDLCSGGYFTTEYNCIDNATSIYAQFIKVGYLLKKYTKKILIREIGELDLAWAHQNQALKTYKSTKGLHDSLDVELLIYDCLSRSFRTRKMWNLALECYTNVARIGFNFFLLNHSATLHRYFDIAQECERRGQSQLAIDLLAKSKVKLDQPRRDNFIRRGFTSLYRW